MEEELKVNNAEELLEESLKILSDKKDTQKALKDSVSNILEQTSGDKYYWGIVSKVYANKGNGWIGGDPLNLDKDEPHKDVISGTFKKLAETIDAFVRFNQLEKLQEYFDALADKGIKIEVDESKFEKYETGSCDVDDFLDSQKSYIKTIADYSDELKNVHAVKSEELNFAPASEYLGLLGIYKKGIEGKDVEDAVQDKVTHCEWTETAYNLVKEKIDSSLPQ